MCEYSLHLEVSIGHPVKPQCILTHSESIQKTAFYELHELSPLILQFDVCASIDKSIYLITGYVF